MYTSSLFSANKKVKSTQFVLSQNLNSKFFTILSSLLLHTLSCNSTKSGTIKYSQHIMLFTKCWRFILLSSYVFLSINTVTTHTPFHVKVYCCRSINFHKYHSIHTGRVPLLTKLLGLHCTPFYLGSSSSFQIIEFTHTKKISSTMGHLKLYFAKMYQ